MTHSSTVLNQESADLLVIESTNPYLSCIQGLADEPVTVQALLQRAQGGGIGALVNGNLLRLSHKRIDRLDRAAFLRGTISPLTAAPLTERAGLIAQRRANMEHRQRQIAACSIMDKVTDAEFGIVPMAVHRRATVPWLPVCN